MEIRCKDKKCSFSAQSRLWYSKLFCTYCVLSGQWMLMMINQITWYPTVWESRHCSVWPTSCYHRRTVRPWSRSQMCGPSLSGDKHWQSSSCGPTSGYSRHYTQHKLKYFIIDINIESGCRNILFVWQENHLFPV